MALVSTALKTQNIKPLEGETRDTIHGQESTKENPSRQKHNFIFHSWLSNLRCRYSILDKSLKSRPYTACKKQAGWKGVVGCNFGLFKKKSYLLLWNEYNPNHHQNTRVSWPMTFWTAIFEWVKWTDTQG